MPPVLRQGSHGPDVVLLQQWLQHQGYYGGAIDGDFGWRTHVALTKYQDAAGLRSDGVAGDDTWHSLTSAAGPQTGLRAEEHVDDYVQSAYGAMNSSMSADDRLARLIAPALQELGELAVPLPTYGFDGTLSGSDTLAEFRSTNQWHVAANPDRFQPAAVERMNEQQLGEVANTVYHESRHAEMTFREARAQAGLGQDVAALVASMKLPQHIAEAAVAAKIVESTADGATDEALRGYDSYYGSGAAATQDTYTHGSYDQYRRLPEEDDAMEAGHNVSAEWRRFSGVRGTVEHGDRGDDVSYVQRALIQQGFYHGSVDGDFGTATQAAVSEFQQHHGLHVDGVCGERTWEALAAVYAE